MAHASANTSIMTHHERKYTAAQGAQTSAGIPLATLKVTEVGMQQHGLSMKNSELLGPATPFILWFHAWGDLWDFILQLCVLTLLFMMKLNDRFLVLKKQVQWQHYGVPTLSCTCAVDLRAAECRLSPSS